MTTLLLATNWEKVFIINCHSINKILITNNKYIYIGITADVVLAIHNISEIKRAIKIMRKSAIENMSKLKNELYILKQLVI